MKQVKSYVSLIAVLAIAVLAVACGGSTPEPIEINIELSEFAYTPGTIEVQVGQEVTINIVNNGALEHEFMIGQNAMEMDGVVSMFTTDFFTKAGVDAPEILAGSSMEDMDHDDDGDDMEDMDGDDMEDMDGDDMEDMDHDDDGDDMEDMDHDDDDMGGMDHGFMVTVPKGESASFTFIVTEEMVGEWELGCFLDSGAHFTAGMTGSLVVTE